MNFRNLSFRRGVAALLAYLMVLQPLVLQAAELRANRRPVTPALYGFGLTSAAGAIVAQPASNFEVLLEPLTTAFHGHAGIDHHPPSDSVLVTAAGQTSSLELIAANGEHRPFANPGALPAAAVLATVRTAVVGGFPLGEVFTSTSAAGIVNRVGADGSSFRTIALHAESGGESGKVTGLHVDADGSLLAVTDAGGVWRVTAAGATTRVATLPEPLASVVTVPADAPRYGPLAGKILAGASGKPLLYAVDATGAATSFALNVVADDLAVIPPHQNFYAVDSVTKKLVGASDDAFAAMAGDLVIAQSAPGVLVHLRWNGTQAETAQIAQASRFDQIAFSPAGLAQIAPVKRVYDAIAVVRHAPLLSSGRVEGSLWQLAAEDVTLDGTDVITGDLLMAGTPRVVIGSGKPSFGGVIEGTESAQPSTHTLTLANNAVLRHLVNRTDGIDLTTVAAPPAPAATRDATLTKASDTAGDFATLRNLTISGQAGSVSVPPGTYGAFSATGRTALVLGVSGATEPAVYHLQSLSLGGGSELRVVGPVSVTVAGAVTFTGSTIGAPTTPRQFVLNAAGGPVAVTGNAVLYGIVRAPSAAVTIDGNSRVRGTVTADTLRIQGNGVLEVTENDLPPPAVNRPPTVDAGADQTTTLPADTITLGGLATDDGLPKNTTLSIAWTTVSGPAAVTFGDAGAATTTATFTTPGTYVLRLTAHDSLLASTDEVTVTVIPRNQAPAASAGDDQTIELPQPATLVGSVSDDGLPMGSTLTTAWRKVDGPGTVTFADATALSTTVTFSVAGSYTVELSATDGELTATDTLAVTVQPENQAPVVSAGADQTLVDPATATLAGTASDDGWPQGSTLTTLWTKVSGPGTVTFANPLQPATTAAFSAAGVYVLRLSATDSREVATDDVTITIDPANEAPVARAGGDQTIELPDAASLTGTVTDDGWPRGSTLTSEWTVVSGPAAVAFADATKPRTAAAFTVAGTYVLRLTATDGTASDSDEVTITVHPENQAPVVSAGPDATAELPSAATLAGTVTDDGWPEGSTVTAQWTKVSGPGSVSFADPTAPVSAATFGAEGTYVLRLTATDTRLTMHDEVTITVYPMNVAPAVDAGEAQTIRLPLTAALTGTVSDDGWPFGSTLTSEWTLVSGPGGVIFANAAQPVTTATFSVAGTYVLRLNATDTRETTSDDVTITALPANEAPAVDAGADRSASLHRNLLRNGGNEQPLAEDGSIIGWSGSGWTKGGSVPASAEGDAIFAPGSAGELTQDADVSLFPAGQTYTFAAMLRGGARVVVEYRDPAAVVLATYEATATAEGWNRVTDTRVAPAGTASVRVRLIATTAEGYFDAVTLRAAGTAAVQLAGSATDDGFPAGNELATTWSVVSGPGSVAFANPAAAATSAAFTVSGVYTLRLTAADGELTVTDDVVVTIDLANTPPVVEAGADDDVKLPSSATLHGVVSDDGLPAGETLSVSWSVLTAPAPPTFGDAASAATTVSFTAPGAYVLRLSASDSQRTVHDELTIVVRPANRGPIVTAGFPQTIVLPSTATLQGTAVDPDGQPLTLAWTMVSGPGSVAFGSPASETTTAAFSEAGEYVLRLTATDGELSDSDDVTITVEPELVNQAPVVEAGPNGTTQVGQGLALNGTVSDDGLPGGATLTLTWSMVSGPGTASFANAGAAGTVVTFDRAGVYVLRLTASDSLLTTSDELTVTVRSAPVASFTVAGPERAPLTIDNNLASLQMGAQLVAVSGINSTSYLAEYILDDLVATRWRSPASSALAANQFVIVQLAGDGPRTFDRFRITNVASSEGIKNFRVDVSTTTTEEAAFTTVFTGVAGATNRIQEFRLAAPAAARYVRLFMIDAHGSTVMSLRSFAVIGAGLTGIPSFLGPANLLAASEEAVVIAQTIGSGVSATDGNPTTFWSTGSSRLTNQSFTVDLGMSHRFERVRLFNLDDTRSVKDFRLEISNDNVTYTTAFAGTALLTGAVQEFTFAPVQARYVRFFAVNNHGSTATMGIRDLEVPSQYASEQSVSSYNGVSANNPENLFDNDVNSPWMTYGGRTTNQYVEIELGRDKPELVDSVLIHAYGSVTADAVKDFELLASTTTDDDAAFTPVVSGTVANDGTAQRFTFPGGPLRARYFRFVAKNNHGSTSWIRIGTMHLLTVRTEGNLISAPTASTLTLKNASPALLTNGATVVGQSSGAPTAMMDYTYGSPWSTSSVANQWVKIQLGGGTAHTLSGIILGQRVDSTGTTDSVKDFEVWVSTTTTDDAAFTRVLTATATTVKVLQTFRFDAPVEAKYVKYVPRTNHGGAASIATGYFDVTVEPVAAGVYGWSSMLSGRYNAQLALDANTSTGWVSAPPATDQWITVALPERKTAYGVVITPDPSFIPKDFEIRVSSTSTDEAAFTTVYSGVFPNTGSPVQILFGRVADARYVQFYFRNAYVTTGIGVREVNVLTLPDDGATLIAYPPANTSAFTGSSILDVNATTGIWLSPVNQVTNHAFIVALPPTQGWMVDHVAVQQRLDCACPTYAPRQVEVQVATNDTATAWRTVWAGTLRNNDNRLQHVFFPAVEARYVRLLILNNWGAQQTGIQNFLVYSPQIGALDAHFIDTSRPGDAPIASYQWQFGDGASSSDRDPRHTYAAPGEYDVRLTVLDGNGLTSTKEMRYRVDGAPRVDFTIAPQPANEAAGILFTDTSSSDFGPIGVREWIWGDGLPNGANATASHAYADNGTYQATLKVTSLRGITGSITKPVTVVNVAPTVTVGADRAFAWGSNWPVTVSVNDVSSADRSSLHCTWNFGDGQTLERANCYGTNYNHTYAAPGTYTATLTVRDKDGATASDSAVYTVTTRPTVISYGGSRGVVPGQPLALSATLRDDLSHDFIPNKTVVFTVEGGQTASAVTNAEGLAEATIVYNGTAETPSITSAFAGDDRYGASSATIAASCPAEQQPIDVGLVFDLSGSMLGERLTAARSGALIFLDSLQRHQDQAAAVSFTGSGRVEQQLTYDLDAVREAIDEMNASGGTDVGAGIRVGHTELLGVRRNPYARPIMILYSDGETGYDSAITAANNAKAAGIRIISVMIGGNAAARQLMKDIASGPGDYYEAIQTSELAAIYASIVSSICEPANKPPVVDPGSDQTIVLPANTVSLNGTVTDDGRPPLAKLTTTWTKDSGPGTVTFADASRTATTATFSVAGEYVLRLSANDTQYVRSSSIAVNVHPENQPPVVSAGADRTISLPSVIEGGPTTTTITLTGSVTDDGWPFGSSVTQEWTMASGPAAPSFETAGQTSTKVTFAEPGTYVLRLTATDTEDTVSDDVTIVVEPGNRAPAVDAGADVTATLSAGATLNGAVTDDGRPSNSSVTVAWTKVSGPGAVTFATPSAAITGVTFNVLGTYVLRLTAGDGELSSSDEVTVIVDITPGNQAPSVSAGADVSITDPVNSTTLSGSVSDDGIPSATLGLGWVQLSGPAAATIADPSSAVTAVSFALPGTYVFRLSAGDGELSSSDEVVVTFNRTPGNTAPAVNAGADTTITTNSVALNGTASDDGLPNGGGLTVLWTKVSGPGTVTFGNPAAAATSVTFSSTGVYVLRLTGSDSELTASDDVTVRYDGVNQAPVVSAGADTTARVSQFITLGGSVTDDSLPLGSTLTITWTKVSGPGTVTFSSASLPASQVRFSAMGTYVLRLTASDSALSSSDEVTVTVDAAAPPPAAEITSPESGATITERTVFTGTVGEGTTWRLEHRLNPNDAVASTNPWTTIATGSGPITNGVIGTFDPTVLVNGTYKVRLVVEDTTTGQTSAPFVTAVVEGDLKVGFFSLSFQDLGIPLPGLPVSVSRTYDSRDTRVGDFGHGWRLGMTNIRVEKSGALGSGWQETVSGGRFPNYCLVAAAPRFVTFTFPDGEVHRFRLAVTPSCQLFAPIQTPTVYFEPVGDTRGSLVALGDNDVMVHGSIPGPVDLITADVEVYNPTRFRLTTEEGTVYEIDEQLGVRKITDRSKNTLTFGPNGITHSAGANVTFVRDSLGRITSIVDAEGKTLTYTYDGRGDLVKFTDQTARSTTFTYNNSHGMLDYFDSMGRRGIRSEYDATGRLIALVDADGNRQSFDFDPNSRTEVVTDRRGKTSVFQYDKEGNILSISDADGKTRSATYDGNGNMLTSTDKLGQVTTYTYDTAGNVRTVKDAENRVTTYTYDTFRQITSITDPANGTESYGYDPATGLMTSITDDDGNVTRIAYDPLGNIESITDPLGHVRRFVHDARGNVTKETDTLGKSTTHTYDAMGRRVTSTDPYGHTTTYTYDDAGRLTKTTDHLGNTTTEEYDAAGNASALVDSRGNRTAVDSNAKGLPTLLKLPDGVEMTMKYDAEDVLVEVIRSGGATPKAELNAAGEVTKFILAPGIEYVYELDDEGRRKSETDPRGHKTRFTWNAMNKRTSMTDPLGHVTGYQYDGAGNLTEVTDPNQHKTGFVYDGMGQLKKKTLPNGFSFDYGFDEAGNHTSTRDPRGSTTTFAWTPEELLDKVTEADGVVTSFGYDDNGNRTSVTDGKQRVLRLTYDEVDRLTKRTYADGSTETFAYLGGTVVESRIDRMGRKTTYAYDKRNRISAIAHPDGSATSFTYTADDRVDTISEARGVTDYDYDLRGNVTRYAQADGTVITYTYDLAGNRETMTTPEGTTRFTHDAANRLESVTDPHGHVTRYSYDPSGNVTKVEYPNGLVTTKTYTPLNMVASITTVNAAGATVFRETYDYDETGNRTSIVAHDGASTTFTYDALLRLDVETQRAADGTVLRQLDYDYDETGNRKAVTDLLHSSTRTYVYNTLDQLVSTGTTAFTYDGNGNTRTAGGIAYDYDVRDRLTVAEVGPYTATYTYDAQGNRVRETTGGVVRDFALDAARREAEVVLERDASSAIVASYTHGHDLISATRGGQEVFYVYDALGSVRAIADATGTLTDTMAYDAFGNMTARSGITPNDYFYRGERLDAVTGLYHLRARNYDPSIGRFIEIDSWHGREDMPQTRNRYIYALNNPVNRIDPNGHVTRFEGTAAHGVIGRYYESIMAGYGVSGRQIAGGGVGKKKGGKGKFPDLREYLLGDVYEIKPLSPYGLLRVHKEARDYVDALNNSPEATAPWITNQWQMGEWSFRDPAPAAVAGLWVKGHSWFGPGAVIYDKDGQRRLKELEPKVLAALVAALAAALGKVAIKAAKGIKFPPVPLPAPAPAGAGVQVLARAHHMLLRAPGLIMRTAIASLQTLRAMIAVRTSMPGLALAG